MQLTTRRAFLQGLVAVSAAGPWLSIAAAPPKPLGGSKRYVSPYDLMTQQGLAAWRLLRRELIGDSPAQWGLIRKVQKGQIGDLLGPLLDPVQVAGIMATMTPIGDRALPRYQDIVTDCAATLECPRPRLATINETMIHPGSPHVYQTLVGKERYLVVSSRMLELYQDDHDQLRFVLGRELARTISDSVELRRRLFSLLAVIVRNSAALLATIGGPLSPIAAKLTEYAQSLVPLVLARFFELSFEEERAADRGGLLCCRSRLTAENALLREATGISGALARKYGGDFDPEGVLKAIESWRDAQVGTYLPKLAKITPTSPFLDQRVAAMRSWEKDGGMQRVLNPRNDDRSQRLQIEHIELTNVVSANTSTNLYVRGYNWANKEICSTDVVLSTGDAAFKVAAPEIQCRNGEQLYFEIRNRSSINRMTGGIVEGYVRDPLLGAFFVHPSRSEKEFAAKIRWDTEDRSTLGRDGVAVIRGKWRDA
jgi:Zn-dependent protease with chaperone function